MGATLRRSTPAASEASSTSSSSAGRFVPGTILAGRYRIVARVGRGGMGEVYRADDLKLGQPVALKFLPVELQSDPRRLERLLGEVRLARSISHPNVCRVYDIVEAEGMHFLSMEFVDGEDLASLLKKVDRLAGDRALRIARQIGAGLHAAHERGILHRDLKPHNVMIDGNGRVRITDFGLAGVADELHGAEVFSGTPAFMAPEQLSGAEVTVRSDVFSLGIVLYELFTGKRPFEGRDRLATPSSPSSHVEDLDPAAERVILRCLETDPRLRPESALAVISALPGGDPLAAALAAGETPSPAIVAQAGEEGTLAPRVAVPLLLFALAMLAFGVHLHGKNTILTKADPDLPPQVLVDRARQVLAFVGHDVPARDSAYHFYVADEVLDFIDRTDSSTTRWDRLATEKGNAVGFWYRESPELLVPIGSYGRVMHEDPPFVLSGMARIHLDGNGALYSLEVVPPQLDERSGPHPDPDWAPLFAAAELDPADFRTVEPIWSPESYCDHREAWIGSPEGWLADSVRVEAGSFHGKPNYFLVVGGELLPWRVPGQEPPLSARLDQLVFSIFSLLVLLGGGLLAWRNLRLGRGDRRGAFILGMIVFASYQIAWIFQSHHTLTSARVDSMFEWTGYALLQAASGWLMYLALEPFVRRRWPRCLVSWSRLISGRLTDPLVGRHLLYGATIGAGMLVLGCFQFLAPELIGHAGSRPANLDWDTLLGPRWVIGELFLAMRHIFVNPMTALFVVVFLTFLTRSRWVGMGLLIVLFSVPSIDVIQELPVVQIPLAVLIGVVFVATLVRIGLVATMSAYLILGELTFHPLTLDFSTWYAGSTLIPLLLVVVITLFGFFTSLGGQSLIRDDD